MAGFSCTLCRINLNKRHTNPILEGSKMTQHDPCADQHFDFTPDMTPAEIHKAKDDAAHEEQFQRYSERRHRATAKMPSALADISEVETVLQPEQRVYVDRDQATWRLNEDGSKTVVQDQIPADFPVINIPEPDFSDLRKEPVYDWSNGVPQFVEDLETAIESTVLIEQSGQSASQIAAELLKHPALHGYLDQGVGEIAHVDLSDFAMGLTEQEFLGNATEQFVFLGNAKEQGVNRLLEAVRNVQPEPDPLVQLGEERWERRRPQLIAQARNGIAALQELAGMAAEHKGFHEDRPASGPELTNWQGNKLMLIVSEAVEAHDEIRSGHTAYETYYVPKEAVLIDAPEKPEGVPSEIADVVIRSADFAWTEGFDLADIIIEKLEYNATRGHKHGKAF